MATKSRLLLGCFLLALIWATRLDAQTQNAAISGTVTDPTGAVLAGAAVQARNVGTGISQSSMSDEQGRFRMPDLQIGEYEVQASRSGFQTVVHKGITLNVGGQLVVDFTLPVGQAQQTVTVQGEVSVVDTQSTAVGSLVESAQVRELPLNGRNYTSLLTLAAGVIQIPLGLPARAALSTAMGRSIPSPDRVPPAKPTCWMTRIWSTSGITDRARAVWERPWVWRRSPSSKR